MTWDTLYDACITCKNCRLAETRTNVVFGDGNRNANILFIGEAPGKDEDLSGTPFVGRGGKLLDEMLALIGLNRENIFLSNIVKCRPPANRDPLQVEQKACTAWLESQISLLSPKIIVCIGRIAACYMMRADFKITRDHGNWFYTPEGIAMMAIYHPAALLRDPRKRPDTFADLKKLQAKILELCPDTYEN